MIGAPASGVPQMDGPLFTVADDVTLWIADGGSIHIKTREPNGDPVELTEEDALDLAAILTKLVSELRG
jgi:hypothetical protein